MAQANQGPDRPARDHIPISRIAHELETSALLLSVRKCEHHARCQGPHDAHIARVEAIFVPMPTLQLLP